MPKFYLTTPIYYASGAPHFGHAFTTLYADVIARYKKQRGDDVFLTAGMDEHGAKIAEKAKAVGKSPQEFVDGLAEEYKTLWKKLGVQNDDFIRTTSEKHKKGVYAFLERLWQKGDIYKGEYAGLYCVGCEKFLTEKDLVDGVCPDHLRKPELVKEENYFFNLKKYLPLVKEKIVSGELEIFPESRRNETLSIIESGADDFSISREKVEWGIPFPYDSKQTIYVWGEALTSYVSVLDFPDGEKYKKYWPADLHLIGVDINKFHTIFWPAMLMSAELLLPKKIFVHGLFTVNGQKMSKTLGNVVDPNDLINRFGADAARYIILSQFSALEHGDVKADEFDIKYNADLANGFGNLFERVFSMYLKYRSGDNKNMENKNIDAEVERLINEAKNNYQSHMDNIQIFEALRVVLLFAKHLDKYINEKSPWDLYKTKGQGAELDEVLDSLMAGVEKIINWLLPFMPEKMEKADDFFKKVIAKQQQPEDKLGLFPRVI